MKIKLNMNMKLKRDINTKLKHDTNMYTLLIYQYSNQKSLEGYM